MSTFHRGDRVRVTFEGEVRENNGLYAVLLNEDKEWVLEFRTDRGVTVEKIEPPVETFGPGDRLRRRGFLDYEVTLGDDGYLQHLPSGRVSYFEYSSSDRRDSFNSERFDKIELAEVPF